MDLTIAIPTYKRHLKVKALVNSLLSEKINEIASIVVQDNDPYSNLNFDKRIVYNRNEVNVGPMGNISRILFHCNTKWLIILGDDDLISENFRDKLSFMASIISPEIVAIKTRGGLLLDKEDKEFYSKHELLKYLEADSNGHRFSGFMWISSWIINVEICKYYMKNLYLNAGFNMPQMILPLIALNESSDRKIVYMDLQLFYQKDSTDLTDTWNDGVVYGQMISSLYTASFISKKEMVMFIRALVGTKPLKILAFIYRHHLFAHTVKKKSLTNYYVSNYHSIMAKLFCVTKCMWIPLIPSTYKKKYSLALKKTLNLERL